MRALFEFPRRSTFSHEVTYMPTFGERAVGLSFNPSNIGEVHVIKKMFAEVIDWCDQMRAGATQEQKRMYSVAITEAQTAQMWAVKAVTWRDD